MILAVVVVAILVLFIGYRVYGNFLSRQFNLTNTHPTPAVQFNDGIDYVPAHPTLLLGQHFSAIAAAGPIVGPILAGIWFGWLPALLWILLGSIFIGGVHDFTSLVASIRHKAASIGEIVKQNMSRTAHILFLIFVWACLIYVIIAFTDITAQTFKTTSAYTAFGAGVAGSSVLYIIAAMVMGIFLYKFKLKLWLTTLIFLPIVLFIIWIGPHLPKSILSFLQELPVKQWHIFLLLYCFIASIIPMWLLLQPRGYLGGWLLYLIIAISLIGVLFGRFEIGYPAFKLVGLKSVVNGNPIFPILFITIACGACSGFHGIVCSGTTSKQLARETDAKIIGLGGMLLEGLVAVLALATLMILPQKIDLTYTDPNLIYANGIARYMGLIGVGFNIAFPFALLAFSTFVYDTLDVCTRLARYVFQEITGLRTRLGGVIATVISLSIPLAFLMTTQEKGYLVAWQIFGTSNQLLASLILLAVSVWLIKSGKKVIYTILPMCFMLVMTFWSLGLKILSLVDNLPAWISGQHIKPDIVISGITSSILFTLSLCLVLEAVRVLRLKKGAK
ncbi:MAG: carbon starvation protein A [Candidatus Stahlbacteria bacterium]|nr:carbon starvation protein A [Candidatus Stahlbacteria bacterium]